MCGIVGIVSRPPTRPVPRPDEVVGGLDAALAARGDARAVGAALGEVAGQIEKIYRADPSDRRASRADAAAEATERARLAGADPATIEVVAVEELPVAYSDGTAVLIRARAVGRLAA